MRKIFYVLYFLILYTTQIAFAQSRIYLEHEVDSAAVPTGGWDKYDLYLRVNLKYPQKALFNKISGRVSFEGIVDTLGNIHSVKLLKGIDSLCDAEAFRLVSSFNAWSSAIVKGNKVEQKIYPFVNFKLPNNPTCFFADREVLFYDEKGPVDSTKAKFKMEKVLDSMGNPNKIILTDLQSKRVNEYQRKIERVEKEFNGEGLLVNQQISYRTLFLDEMNRTIGQTVDYSSDNKVVRKREYDFNSKCIATFSYYPNGIVKEFEYSDVTYEWYDNGRFKKQLTQVNKDKANCSQLLEYWTKSGVNMVKNGNGYAEVEDSKYVFKGNYINGLREGVFIGETLIGKVKAFEENYENGKLISGVNLSNNVTYNTLEGFPSFIGGMEKIGPFIGRNLKYPAFARKNKIQGRVTLAFVIKKDGKIDNVRVLRGIGGGCDDVAKEVVERMDGYWIPGTQRGEPVNVHYSLPIMFRLE